MCRFQVYLEVRKYEDGVLLFAAVNTPFPVRKPTTERLALFYHIKRYCGRLTNLQKVSLPLCKTLPLRHLRLHLCFSAPKTASTPPLVFFFLRFHFPCRVYPVAKGGSDDREGAGNFVQTAH